MVELNYGLFSLIKLSIFDNCCSLLGGWKFSLNSRVLIGHRLCSLLFQVVQSEGKINLKSSDDKDYARDSCLVCEPLFEVLHCEARILVW